MKKIILPIIIVATVFLFGCGQKNNSNNSQGEVKEEKKVEAEKEKKGGIEDVCNYFPKELIESAIGKPIVKVEVPFTGKESCFYYTLYSDDYDHTPYGDKPGGTPVVAVYDTEDFAKDKASNEKTGSKFVKDETIKMDNYVVRDFGGTIWQVVLILGQDKYIRMHFVHSAVTGEDLVKIGQKFAEKIVAGK